MWRRPPRLSSEGEAERSLPHHKHPTQQQPVRESRYSKLSTDPRTNRVTPHVTSDSQNPRLLSQLGRFSRRNACAFRRFASSLDFLSLFRCRRMARRLSLSLQFHRRSPDVKAPAAASSPAQASQLHAVNATVPKPPSLQTSPNPSPSPLPAPKSTPPSAEKPSPLSPATTSAGPAT